MEEVLTDVDEPCSGVGEEAWPPQGWGVRNEDLRDLRPSVPSEIKRTRDAHKRWNP